MTVTPAGFILFSHIFPEIFPGIDMSMMFERAEVLDGPRPCGHGEHKLL
jgi:hypothetical protein